MFESVQDCGGPTPYDRDITRCPLCHKRHRKSYRLKNSERICTKCDNEIRKAGEKFKREHWTEEDLEKVRLFYEKQNGTHTRNQGKVG